MSDGLKQERGRPPRRGGDADAVRKAFLIDGIDPGGLAMAPAADGEAVAMEMDGQDEPLRQAHARSAALRRCLHKLETQFAELTVDVRLWLRGNLLRERKSPTGVNSITAAEAFC